MGRRHWPVLAGILIALLLASWLWLSPVNIFDRFEDVLYSQWFPLVLVGLYLVRPLLAWPITAISALVGYRYGLVMGVPIALVGVVFTSMLPYAVGRYVGTESWLVSRATTGSERYFEAVGDLRGLIAARLAPTPAEAISIGAGLGRVSVPAFVLGTLLGEIPWTIAAVLAGRSLTEFSASSLDAVDPIVVGGALLGALLLLAGPAYRTVRDRMLDRAANAT